MSKDKEIPKEGRELVGEFTKKTEDPAENKATEVAGDFLTNQSERMTNEEANDLIDSYFKENGKKDEFSYLRREIKSMGLDFYRRDIDKKMNSNKEIDLKILKIDEEERDFLNNVADKLTLFLKDDNNKDSKIAERVKTVVKLAKWKKEHINIKRDWKNEDDKNNQIQKEMQDEMEKNVTKRLNIPEVTKKDINDLPKIISELNNYKEGSSADLINNMGALRYLLVDNNINIENLKKIREEIQKIKKVEVSNFSEPDEKDYKFGSESRKNKREINIAIEYFLVDIKKTVEEKIKELEK